MAATGGQSLPTRSRFTVTSGPPLAGITRSFTILSQATRDNAESQVLGGIHFRTALPERWLWANASGDARPLCIDSRTGGKRRSPRLWPWISAGCQISRTLHSQC